MKYTKPALTFTAQADLLISRGLIVDNRQALVDYLTQVSYYRLSGYWYIFKVVDPNSGEEKFKPGTTFQLIRARYEFDRQLRFLLLDAIERIEIGVFRTRMVETHTLMYGPFGYIDQHNYNPKFTEYSLQKLLVGMAEDEERSHEEFIKRYRSKYNEEQFLPLWMVAELMSFGQFLTFYKNQHITFKQTISHQFNLFPMVLDSWLLTLNTVRNICAHHSRFWNRPLPLPIAIPDKKHDPRWYVPMQISNSSVFSALTIVAYLLKFILPANNFKSNIQQLLDGYPIIPLKPMGFPENWQDLPLWN